MAKAAEKELLEFSIQMDTADAVKAFSKFQQDLNRNLLKASDSFKAIDKRVWDTMGLFKKLGSQIASGDHYRKAIQHQDQMVTHFSKGMDRIQDALERIKQQPLDNQSLSDFIDQLREVRSFQEKPLDIEINAQNLDKITDIDVGFDLHSIQNALKGLQTSLDPKALKEGVEQLTKQLDAVGDVERGLQDLKGLMDLKVEGLDTLEDLVNSLQGIQIPGIPDMKALLQSLQNLKGLKIEDLDSVQDSIQTLQRIKDIKVEGPDSKTIDQLDQASAHLDLLQSLKPEGLVKAIQTLTALQNEGFDIEGLDSAQDLVEQLNKIKPIGLGFDPKSIQGLEPKELINAIQSLQALQTLDINVDGIGDLQKIAGQLKSLQEGLDGGIDPIDMSGIQLFQQSLRQQGMDLKEISALLGKGFRVEDLDGQIQQLQSLHKSLKSGIEIQDLSAELDQLQALRDQIQNPIQVQDLGPLIDQLSKVEGLEDSVNSLKVLDESAKSISSLMGALSGLENIKDLKPSDDMERWSKSLENLEDLDLGKDADKSVSDLLKMLNNPIGIELNDNKFLKQVSILIAQLYATLEQQSTQTQQNLTVNLGDLEKYLVDALNREGRGVDYLIAKLDELQKASNIDIGITDALKNPIERLEEALNLKERLEQVGNIKEQFEESVEMAEPFSLKSLIESSEEAGKFLVQPLEDFLSKDLNTIMKRAASILRVGLEKGAGGLGKLLKVSGAKLGGLGPMGKALGGPLKGLGSLIQMVGKLGPLISMGTAFIAGFVKILVDAEAGAKQFNKELLSSSGSIDFFNQHIGDTNAAIQDMQSTLDSARSSLDVGMGISKDEVSGFVSTLSGAGVSLYDLAQEVQNAQGPIHDIPSTIKASVAYARAYGVQLSELSQLQGELMSDIGLGMTDVIAAFQQIGDSAKLAGVNGNKFFNMVRSFSSDLTLFSLRLQDITKVLGVMAKAMDPRKAQQTLQTLTSAFKGGTQENLRTVVLAGEDNTRDRLTKTFNRGLASLSDNVGNVVHGLSDGDQLTQELIGLIRKGDPKKIAQWEAKVNTRLQKAGMKQLDGALMGSINSATDMSRSIQGGLVDMASQLGNLDPTDKLALISKTLENTIGKKLDTLSNTEILASEAITGMSDDQRRDLVAFIRGVQEQEQELIEHVRTTPMAQMDPDQVKQIQKLGVDTSKGPEYIVKELTRIFSGENGRDKYLESLDQGQRDQLLKSAEIIDQASKTADFQTSLTDRIDIITDVLFNNIYKILRDIYGVVVDFFTSWGSGSQEDKGRLRASKQAIVGGSNQLSDLYGGKLSLKEANEKALNEIAPKVIEAAKSNKVVQQHAKEYGELQRKAQSLPMGSAERNKVEAELAERRKSDPGRFIGYSVDKLREEFKSRDEEHGGEYLARRLVELERAGQLGVTPPKGQPPTIDRPASNLQYTPPNTSIPSGTGPQTQPIGNGTTPTAQTVNVQVGFAPGADRVLNANIQNGIAKSNASAPRR